MKTVLATLTVVGLAITIIIETGCIKILLKELDRKDGELRSLKDQWARKMDDDLREHRADG